MKLVLKSGAIGARTVGLGPMVGLLAEVDAVIFRATQLDRRASWSSIGLAALNILHGNE